MKDRKYIVIGVIIVIILGMGCIENVSPTTKVENPQEKQVILSTPTLTPTPAHTPASKVIIEHSMTSVSKLTTFISSEGPVYEYSSPGMTFLVIHLKILNQGYQMIPVNQYIWSLKVSTKDNPNAYTEAKKMFYGEADGIVCKNTELENGGWTTCKIPFEAPINYDRYKIYYIAGNNANIEWVPR